MYNYGLTENEKNMNLHKYNHALFQNMESFIDSCWEISIKTGTMVMLYESIFPDYINHQLEYKYIFNEYLEKKVYSKDKSLWIEKLSISSLSMLEEEISFNVRLYNSPECAETYHVVATPTIDSNGCLESVYVSTKNIENDIRMRKQVEKEKESNEYLRRILSVEEQYRRAVVSGAILVYNINISKNLVENEIFEMTEGGRIPIVESVGMTTPCNYDVFIKKWAKVSVFSEDREKYLSMFDRDYLLSCYEKGDVEIVYEYRAKSLSNICMTLKKTLLIIQDEDGDIIALCNVKDVTIQRAREQKTFAVLKDALKSANMANQAKSDFLSRMSHDIRTPMNAIIGMTAIAGLHLDDAERIKYCLNKIAISSKHMLTVINEILDMSKVDSGQIDLHEEAFNIEELIKSVIDVEKGSAIKHNHEFNFYMEDIKHKFVWGDSFRIQEIFTSIMSNAIKYTPDGGRISVWVSEKDLQKSGVGCYEFIFEDNGIGMSEEFQKNIFEPFSRAKDTRINEIQGIGLGMAITKNIVHMMGGEISVTSTLGKGTKFIVNIALRLQEMDEDAKHDEGFTNNVWFYDKGHGFKDRRILLVEDNELNAEIAEEILSQMGLIVENVWNGKEAVDRLLEKEEGYYDLVFMDIQMPVMNGYEAAKAIRTSMRQDLMRIPIIALTANAFSDDIQASFNAGMNQHLAKPLNLGQLNDVLQKWLS